jgi:hypothetical protein
MELLASETVFSTITNVLEAHTLNLPMPTR